MKVTIAEGYEPSVDFVVDVEQNGATMRLHASYLVQQIAAVALAHHPAIFAVVQRAIGEASRNVRAEAFAAGQKAERERIARALQEQQL